MLLKKKRIFIIEDNLINRSIMQLALEQEGATVEFERWGLDTENRLNAFAPVDTILLDIMFPGDITGYEIFDRIRLLPGFSTVPIVVVTALNLNKQIRQKGFSGYIQKPINLSIFPHKIAAVVNGKQLWNNKEPNVRSGE